MQCVWNSSAAHTTYGLAQIPGLGSAGQFCHHLREQQAAGLVVQRRRNRYAVPAGWVIACVILVAALSGGAPTLGSLPHERRRAGICPGRRTRGGRCGSRAREGATQAL
jgi:hypothetical protein